MRNLSESKLQLILELVIDVVHFYCADEDSSMHDTMEELIKELASVGLYEE